MKNRYIPPFDRAVRGELISAISYKGGRKIKKDDFPTQMLNRRLWFADSELVGYRKWQMTRAVTSKQNQR